MSISLYSGRPPAPPLPFLVFPMLPTPQVQADFPPLQPLVPEGVTGGSRQVLTVHLRVQQPNIGGEVVPHQDSTFLYTDPPSVTGLWFALEDATVANGCLFTLPGSHKPGVHRRMVTQPGGGVTFDGEPAQYDLEQFVPVEVSGKGSKSERWALI